MERPTFIRHKDDYLSIFKDSKSGGETRLLAKADSVEVHRQTIPAGKSFFLDSGEEWQGFEFIYLLSGQLSFLDSDTPVYLEPGDYIARHEVNKRSYFKAQTDTVLLYLSSQPAFKFVRKRVEDYVHLAEQIEKDEYTNGHCKRIQALSRSLGVYLDLNGEQLGNLLYASFFHDLGKAKVPKEVLQKPGKLNDEEWVIMGQHTVWGREMLAEKEFLKQPAIIVEQTHERIDGKGYPKGLTSKDICIEAKIISVVDAYDAMTTDRPYRQALPQDEAIRRLQKNRGTQFDRSVVNAFIEMLEEQGLKLPEFDQELARLKRHEAFLRLGEEILSDTNIQQILDHVVSAITEYTPFRRAALALYTHPIAPHSEEYVGIVRVASVGLSEEEVRQLQQNPVAPEQRPQIFDERFRLSRSYYFPEDRSPWLNHPGLVESEEASDGSWKPNDYLCIPMRITDQIMGIISADDPADGQAPIKETLEPIEIFANFAALAIERSRNLGQLKNFQERLKGIYNISKTFSQATSIKDLVSHAIENLTDNFHYTYACIFFKENDHLILQGFNTKLPAEEFTLETFEKLPLAEGVVGWVGQQQKPLLVSNVHEDSRYVCGHELIQSELAVPIEDHGNLLGVLNLESDIIRGFNQEDLELLQTLGNQLGAAISHLKQQQQLQETLDAQAWYTEFLQGLNQAENLNELFQSIIQRGIELLQPKADAGCLLLFEEKRQVFEFVVGVNRNLNKLRNQTFTRDQIEKNVLQSSGPVILSRDKQLKHRVLGAIQAKTNELPPGSTISIPIRDKNQKLVAVFNVNHLTREDIFSSEDAEKLWQLVPEIELALGRMRDREQLREKAIHDPLTGVYNRHYMTEMIERETSRARRHNSPISIILVDFVNFYDVNDRHGHLEGDRILSEAASLFQANVRDHDAVIRYGGDEFLIVLPETSKEHSKFACERMQQSLSSHDWGIDVEISIQVGYSTWDPNSQQSFETTLEEADTWLYQRKRGVKSSTE